MRFLIAFIAILPLVASAETGYVTDRLILGLHQAEDTSDRAFRSLESGTGVVCDLRPDDERHGSGAFALRADLDALAISHDKGFSIHRAFHLASSTATCLSLQLGAPLRTTTTVGKTYCPVSKASVIARAISAAQSPIMGMNSI